MKAFDLSVWKEFSFQWKRLRVLCGPFIRPFVLLSLLTFIIQLMQLAFPYLIGEITQALEKKDRAHLYWCIAGIALITSAQAIMSNFRWWENQRRIAMPLDRGVKLAAMSKAFSMPLGVTSNRAEEIRSLIDRGEQALTRSVYDLSRSFLPISFNLIIIVTGVCIIHPTSGIYAFVCLLVYACMIILVNRSFMPRIKAFSEQESRLQGRLWENLRNTVLVLMRNQQEAARARFAKEHREYSGTSIKLWWSNMSTLSLAKEPISLVCFIILLFTSIDPVFAGELSVGHFVVMMWWVSGAFASVSSLTSSTRDLMEKWPDVSSLLEFLEATPSLDRDISAIPEDGFTGLSFRQVGFKSHDVKKALAGDSPWILDGITFDIEKGSFVAIVGPSGAGKSTLVDLIMGASIAEVGKAFVSRVNIRVIDRVWWWNKIAYVPQGDKLRFWNATVRDNLLYGHAWIAEATQERLKKALELAQLGEFYRDKLDKLIGENGHKLSGGERQRLAIARALIGDPEILVFDEALTGLDSENRLAMTKAILELSMIKGTDGKRKYTIIMVTHEITFAECADKIVLLNGGKIEAIGNSKELSDSCELYRKLHADECQSPSIVYTVLKDREEKHSRALLVEAETKLVA